MRLHGTNALEIRDLNFKQVYDRREILNLVHSQYETLLPFFGKSKGSSNPSCPVSDGRRGRGGKGGGGRRRGRSGKRNEDGKGDTTVGPGKAKDSVPCWRCSATGHYSDSCTTKPCDWCGERGHDSSKCRSPVDMEASAAKMEAVLAKAKDSGDDAVKTTAF